MLASAPVLATEEHALSQKAIDRAHPFGLPITDSMVVTWIAGVALIVFAQLATRNMHQASSGARNFLEWMVEGLYNFLKGILGADRVERTFWFFATIFIFILTANWIGLIPGVGSIVGLIGASAAAAVGRNPGSSTPVMLQSILSIAFAEAIVSYMIVL